MTRFAHTHTYPICIESTILSLDKSTNQIMFAMLGARRYILGATLFLGLKYLPFLG